MSNSNYNFASSIWTILNLAVYKIWFHFKLTQIYHNSNLTLIFTLFSQMFADNNISVQLDRGNATYHL